jgi:DNA-directed RNA polymerase specialized sigma24 family protein
VSLPPEKIANHLNAPRSTPERTEERARTEEISKLYREHNRALVNFVLTRVANEQEAKEIAQEAYVRLLQLDQSVAVSYLRWHLFKIAKHIAVDRYRQHALRSRLDRLDVCDNLDLNSPTAPGGRRHGRFANAGQ